MRVLFADKDREFSEIAHDYLRRHGYEVGLATNGTEYASELSKHVPDVVVLQHGMVPHNASKPLTELRRNRRQSGIPVILIDNGCADAPMLDRPPTAMWLRKPFLLKELLCLLRKCESAGPRIANGSVDSRQRPLTKEH